jgi:hypothetical protein
MTNTANTPSAMIRKLKNRLSTVFFSSANDQKIRRTNSIPTTWKINLGKNGL